MIFKNMMPVWYTSEMYSCLDAGESNLVEKLFSHHCGTSVRYVLLFPFGTHAKDMPSIYYLALVQLGSMYCSQDQQLTLVDSVLSYGFSPKLTRVGIYLLKRSKK